MSKEVDNNDTLFYLIQPVKRTDPLSTGYTAIHICLPTLDWILIQWVENIQLKGFLTGRDKPLSISGGGGQGGGVGGGAV